MSEKAPDPGKKAAVFLSGSLHVTQPLKRQLKHFDPVVAADGGLNHLYSMGVIPTNVIGDFDSVHPLALAWAEDEGITPEKFPQEKNMTDGELAITKAVESGANKVFVYGALSESRPDHTFANLLYALAQSKKHKVEFCLSDGNAAILPLVGPLDRTIDVKQFITYANPATVRVSLVPVTNVENLSFDGLRYALAKDRLTAGSTRGISNELAGDDSFHIRFEEGECFLILCLSD